MPFGPDRSPEVRAAFGAAAAAFDDPIAKLPRNAALRYRKFEVLTKLLQVDRDPEADLQYQERQRAALDAAQSLVSPGDGPIYVSYKGRWADYLAAVNDAGGAEAVYKQLLARPTTALAAGRAPNTQRTVEDVQTRLQYARLLSRDPARWADALAILDAVPTAVPTGLPSGLQQQVARLLAVGRLTRASILMDQLEATANPAVREEKRKGAQAEIDAVRGNARFAGEPEVLKVQGRLQLVSGQFRDAIQTLSAAADRLAGNGGEPDYELLSWQAAALSSGGQPVQAIKLLEQVVRNPPGANLLQPHLMLCQLCLQQQNYDEGRRQVAWLTERYPDDVRTIHEQIDLALHDGDARAVADLYGRLPERNAAEQVDKAAWAVRTRNPTDAERLNELVYAAHPGDPLTAIRLAELYGTDNKRGRANEVLQQAMDQNPQSRGRLQIEKDKINGATEAALRREAADQIDAFADPMARAVARAKLAGSENQLAAQTTELEKAHAIEPDNRQVLRDLFLCYVSGHAYDKADALLPRLVELDVDQAHGLLFKFRLAMARGDVAGAVTIGQQLTRDLPLFANSWSSLGEAMQASGRLEIACQDYAAALDRQGNAPEVVTRLVDCQIRLGRLDDARRTLADARRKFPDAAVYRKQLVQVEVAYGDPESVLPVVDEGVKTQPDVADNWQLAVQAYAAAAQRRTASGDAAVAAGYVDHARQALTDALRKWPDNAGFAAELGDLESREGTDAGIAAAAATFRALAATPKWQDQALPDVLLGRMYLQAKRPELAEAPLRHAVELNPQAVDARTALADSLFGRHLSDAALEVLRPARDQPAVRAKYVDLLLALGRGPEAEADLLADLKAHPDDPIPANLLAHVYAAQGKFDAAEDVATQTLKANPGNVGALYVRGAAEAGRVPPDLDAALRDLTAYRSASPNSVQGRMSLARVMLIRRDVEAAVRELEAAVELAPEAKEPRLLLAKAYLATVPVRSLDAERVIGQALALTALAHDPEVQRVAAAVYLRAGSEDKAVNSIRDAMAHTADQRSLLDEYLNILLATKHYVTLLDESARFTSDPKAGWTLFDYRGRARAASGDVSGAATEFATALDRAGTAPDLSPSLAVASHVTAALGLDRAVEMIQPRSENSTGWKVVLATCFDQGGDKGKALAAVEAALPSIATLPPVDQLYLNRTAGQIYMVATPPQPDRAVAMFQEVLKESPNDLDALNDLACMLAEQVHPPQLAEALKYTQQANEVLRKTGQVNLFLSDTYGWVLILNGRLDEGIDVLHQIVGQALFPDVHYHLAMGYLRKGSGPDARRELDAALDLYRTADGAHQVLDPTLPGKIAAAQKLASDLAAGKPQAQASQ